MTRTIYLDHNATTQLDPKVQAVMAVALENFWGNPSSVHHLGRKARTLLDDARERAAATLKAKPSEIIFTSGGTEANNLAIFGSARLLKHRGNHLITSQIEHPAVLQCFDYLEKREGFNVTRLPVDRQGRVDPDDLKHAFREQTILVSIMAANNEIGSVQPVSQLGELCRQRGILFHTDAVQWFGKEPVAEINQFNADMVSICAHKFHGPKGVGILWIRSPHHPEPLFFGGPHENERRAGTEDLANILGLLTALEDFVKPAVFGNEQVRSLTQSLRESIQSIDGCEIVSPGQECLSNTVAFVTDTTDSVGVLAGLDVEGICASSGSACSSGAVEPSHVIVALGKPEAAHSLVRFSLGRDNTLKEINRVIEVLPEIMKRSQPGRKPANAR